MRISGPAFTSVVRTEEVLALEETDEDDACTEEDDDSEVAALDKETDDFVVAHGHPRSREFSIGQFGQGQVTMRAQA